MFCQFTDHFHLEHPNWFETLKLEAICISPSGPPWKWKRWYLTWHILLELVELVGLSWIIPMKLSSGNPIPSAHKSETLQSFILASALNFIGASLDAPNHGHYTLWWARQGEATPAIRKLHKTYKNTQQHGIPFSIQQLGKIKITKCIYVH